MNPNFYHALCVMPLAHLTPGNFIEARESAGSLNKKIP